MVPRSVNVYLPSGDGTLFQHADARVQGAEQFAGDCQALQAAFRRWTPRPGAHFRELTEACALLSMEPAAATQLVASLHSQPADERGSCPALTALQVLLKILKKNQHHFFHCFRTYLTKVSH